MGTRYDVDMSDKDEIDMAPMIDMVFLLLIFFMITAKATQEGQVPIEQPLAINAKITKEPVDRMPVTLTADDKIYMRGEISDIDKVSKAGPTDDITDMLKDLEDVVSKVRTGGLVGSGAKGHREAREKYLKLQGK